MESAVPHSHSPALETTQRHCASRCPRAQLASCRAWEAEPLFCPRRDCRNCPPLSLWLATPIHSLHCPKNQSPLELVLPCAKPGLSLPSTAVRGAGQSSQCSIYWFQVGLTLQQVKRAHAQLYIHIRKDEMARLSRLSHLPTVLIEQSSPVPASTFPYTLVPLLPCGNLESPLILQPQKNEM